MIAILLVFFCVLTGTSTAHEAPRAVATFPENPIGRFTTYLQESDTPLTIEEAATALESGAFKRSHWQMYSFGINAATVWVHFSVNNKSSQAVLRRLSIESSWLDQIDVWFRRGGTTIADLRMGDRMPFTTRPLNTRGFALEHQFEPGLTDVFLRIENIDPMVLPIYLETPEQVVERKRFENYSYGALYGFLTALLVYNVVLFIGLRESRYVLYSLYLGLFVILNLSYTGHSFRSLWPLATTWTQWAQPTLMLLYSASGLAFALSFLRTREHFPRMYHATVGATVAALLLLGLCAVQGAHASALLLAFSFITLFTVTMVALGAMALQAGLQSARYFLGAAVCAMLGAAMSALSVWGLIPLNLWTYRAIDMGMALEATLLALALSDQFHIAQRERDAARKLARIDPLTQTYNRRAFQEITAPVWASSVRYDRPLSVIMLDLDHFKQFNDTYGHDFGDLVLKHTATAMKSIVREQDIVARWGGEEFVVLLPETSLEKAVILAERLREEIAAISLSRGGAQVSVTISLGVTQRSHRSQSIEELISMADRYLLKAKGDGRNRVAHAPYVPEATNANESTA